jgi:hypothetical protein
MVAAITEILAVLRTADPADKAELYVQPGLSLRFKEAKIV